MSPTWPYQVFFGLLTAIGAWLLVSGLVGLFHRRTPATRLQDYFEQAQPSPARVSALPPLAQRLFAQPLVDLGSWLFRSQSHTALESNLRRSGWRYTSVGDYYGSKIAGSVGLFAAGALAGAALGLNALVILILAAGFGAWGLFLPDLELRRTLTERRDALYREMAWTLDRVAAVMVSGKALEPAINRVTDEGIAWVGGSGGGLFVAVLRDITSGLSTGRSDVRAMLDDLRGQLPEGIPELDEFLQAVQLNLEKRQPIVEQLRSLGRSMRDQLNNRIDELAQKAELKVVALTAGVIVPSLLIVVLGAAVLGFIQAF